ncbi:hypothetical protein ABL78_5166 [Leptomonas seymouri]|uniref:Chorein N-terminal domain-containing protein n=1 Tax=Leptomonas seymouri TaxID=5684 RepID=A0A0N1PAR8_LEPSE|nr:hypothetical protein ABL78_5166 [Leptomonas seymouri]|eukprot:KPI85775.1 hypothetical protein ABL78_5166 [Leptomonas seymouri]
MLERKVAELLAKYLSGFIQDVNAEKLEISLWSGHVVLNNVQLRADMLERVTALLHGEAGNVDSGSANTAAGMSNSPSSFDAAAAAQHGASVRTLLAPFTVVKGVIHQLTIRVPWSSLEREPIHVQVSGVELVLGPLRARPFSAWEEQEREEAIKQQQLKRYEEERQRLSREMAGGTTDGSSAGQSVGGAASGKGGCAATTDAAAEDSAPSWFSWIWDFDRIGQIALRNVSLTLKDVCMRYEFDYEGLHPSLAKAFTIFVREVRLATTNQRFDEAFVSDLLSPLCKQILLTDVVVSAHSVRAPPHSDMESSIAQTGSQLSLSSSPINASRRGGDFSVVLPQDAEATWSTPLPRLASNQRDAYEVYRDRWCFSRAVLKIPSVELRVKIVPPHCVSLHPIVDGAPPLPDSSTELSIYAVEGVHADVCFGVFQTLESMWRSYHQNFECARYRKRLHLLRTIRPRQQPSQHPEVAMNEPVELDVSNNSRSSLFPSAVMLVSRQLARQRWQFAQRCVLDDIQQRRQTCLRQNRSHREVIEGMMQFCQVRRTYCQYWRRTQGVPWAPPLDALEEKKLRLMERQLSLAQVIFLRCLSYAEMRQDENGYARQRAFIEEARLRSHGNAKGNDRQTAVGGSGHGLWGWLTRGDSRPPKTCSHTVDSMSEARGFSALSSPQLLSLADLVTAEWKLGERFASPHRISLLKSSVPRGLPPDMTGGNPAYFTMRCVVETLTVRVDPTYWPLLYGSSVPPPPNTPLRRIQQQFYVRLSALDAFYTTVTDARPDRASFAFFVGSARLSFEGRLRSVLLQSKEAEGGDFLVAKQNACRTHVSVLIAPQLIICQPLHEWRWWAMEVDAFLQWLRALRQTCYTPPPCPKSASQPSYDEASSHRLLPSPPSTAPLMWDVTIKATDVCVPLSARDIGGTDLDIMSHQPSGLSSLVVVESTNTAVPPRDTSPDFCTRRLSSTENGSARVGGDREAQSPGASGAAAARSRGALHDFLFADLLGGGDGGEGEGEECGNAGASLKTDVGSFTSTKPERCFLNNDACLVLSISTTRFVTVAPSQQRRRGEGSEYRLCVGDPDRAVRLFCQMGLSPSTIATNRHLELFSFAVGEVLLNREELSIVFGKGVDFVVEPDALAALNDNLLKPAVFVSNNADARQLQALVEELRALNTKDNGKRNGHCMFGDPLPPLSWRLRISGCIEIIKKADEVGQINTDVLPAVVREFPAECTRHILAAVIPTFAEETWESADEEEEEVAVAAAAAMQDASPDTQLALLSSGVFGGRTIAIGVSVARLLVRSASNEDVAEVVLVAPEEVPAVTAPYRSILTALGTPEPRAVELVWDPLSKQEQLLAVEDGLAGGLRPPHVERRGNPLFLLSIADVTMTTAAGHKLLTMDQLTAVQAAVAPGASVNVDVTVEAASVFMDTVLVDLMEVAVGTYYALRPLSVPPLVALNEVQPETIQKGLSLPQPQHENNTLGMWMWMLTLRVRSIHLQVPLTKNDVDAAPYVEVNACLDSFYTSYEPWLQEGDPSGNQGSRLRIRFDVPDAVQVVDYIGSDPETRSLVTPPPWASHKVNSSGAAHPLRCVVDVVVPGALSVKGSKPAAPVSPTSTCRIDVSGGAVHAYFPLLYLLSDVLRRDERIQRLKELPSSPLFYRGFTSLSRELRKWKGTTTLDSSELTSRTIAAAAPSSLLDLVEVIATISDVDLLLATDAAVPIDTSNPDTLCAVHISDVKAGLTWVAAHTTQSASSTKLRSHGYLDTVTLYLVDLIAPQPKHVRLPNLKASVEWCVLLVPKETLSGYRYQRGTTEDMTVLVGLHPPPAPFGGDGRPQQHKSTGDDDATKEESGAAGASSGTSTMPVVSIDLDASQCRTLIRLFVRNVAQVPLAVAYEGRAWSAHEEVAHSSCSRKQRMTHARQRSLSSLDSSLEERSSPATKVETASALTLLVTLPPVSLVLQAGDAGLAAVRQGTSDAVPGNQGIKYEVSLRRGGHFYAASGGRWWSSPVKNGQLCGLQLSARGDGVHGSTSSPLARFSHEQLLFTADLIGAALVEHSLSSTSPTPEDRAKEGKTREGAVNDDGVRLVRVSAAVRKATVLVPHVRWWLPLYMLFADSAERTQLHCAPQSASAAPFPLQDVLFAAGNRSRRRYGDTMGSCQQSVLLGPRCGSRTGYWDSQPADWTDGDRRRPVTTSQSRRCLYGHVELSQMQVKLGEGENGHGQESRHPLCRLLIPEACLTMAPVGLPQNAGGSSAYDEFTLDFPQCPEVLLRSASTAAAGKSATDVQVVYVSVLKPHPVATVSAATEKNAASASSKSSCIRVRLIRPPHAHISNLQYGRSYRMTDLTLHRASAWKVEVEGLLLNVPANELFSFAQELLRQLAEVRAFFAPRFDLLRAAPFRFEGPLRTYTGIEAQLTNVGVIVSTESPHSLPGESVLSQPQRGHESDLTWCCVTVGSLRMATEVELEDVRTSTGDAATLMDDALEAGWRMRVWHLISKSTLSGVVLAGRHGMEAQWKLPTVKLSVSQPLLRTVLCVRADRDTCVEDASSQLRSERASPVRCQQSATKFYHVEPTSADVCCELCNHFLTRVLIELGDQLPEKDAGKADPPPIVVSVATLFTLSRSATHLLDLWRTAEGRQRLPSTQNVVGAVEEKPSDVTARSNLLPLGESLGPLMWYEVKLAVRGNRVHLAADFPGDTAHEGVRQCAMVIAVEEGVTFHADLEVEDGEVEYASPRVSSEGERGSSLTGTSTSTVIAAVRERYRLCTGGVRVWDSAGNLILSLLNESSGDGGGESHALTAECAWSDGAISVCADHVLLAASTITAVFLVDWFRAYLKLSKLWMNPGQPEKQQEKRCRETEKVDGASSPLFVHVSVEVRQVEVQLPPAGYLVMKRPRLSRTLCAQESPSRSGPRIEEVREVRCDTVSLFSTSVVERPPPQGNRYPKLLARVTAPLLRCKNGAETSTTVFHVPIVSLYNRDRHSWALCAMRTAACLPSLTSLWSSTQCTDSRGSPLPATEADPKCEDQKSNSEAAVASSALPPTFQLLVEKAEILCFAPQAEHTSSDPVLQLCAEHVELMAPVVAEANLQPLASGTVMKDAHAHALLSATYHPSSSARAMPLLEEVGITLTLATGHGRESDTSQVAESEIRLCVAERGFQFHMPANESLESVAGALCLVVGQHVPRCKQEADASQYSSGDAVVECHSDSCGSGTFEARNSRSGELQWCWSADVPRLSCDFLLGPGGQRLAAVDVLHLSARIQPRAEGRRPFTEVRAAVITGETDVTEQETANTSAGAAPAVCFLSARPLASPQKKRSLTAYAFNWRAAPSDMQQFAFFLQQQSLHFSQSDREDCCPAWRSQDDEATTLTVRLQAVHTHITLTFLRAFASNVLVPVVSGARAALATEVSQEVVSLFQSTVVQVCHPHTPLPPLNEMERHAARVRVVELVSDWTLKHDLVLGGPKDGCGLQLHFCNKSPHNVITVRGDPVATGKNKVTVRLTFCESVNGDLNPPIRVDSNMTVKFEHVRVVVDCVGGFPAPLPDAFVALGERALCVFPPTEPLQLPITERTSDAASASKEAESHIQAVNVAALSCGASPWFSTSMYAIDVRVGFDHALTAQQRRLRVAGALQVRYRSDKKRRGHQIIRTEREGEATLTLQRCVNEAGALTRTPVDFVGRLANANEQNTRLKLSSDMGSTIWRIPVGHAQLLVLAAKSIIDAFREAPTAHTRLSTGKAAPLGESFASTTSWMPPVPLTAPKNSKGDTPSSSESQSRTPLDVECVMSNFTLYFTNDLQMPLVACNLEDVSFKSTCDMQFTDVVVQAAAVVSVTDRLKQCKFPNGNDGLKDGDCLKKIAEAPSLLQHDNNGAAVSTARVLFATRPSVTLVWTRFSSNSRSLSLSVNLEEVVVTLPIMSALRVLRRARTDVDAGTHAFWNDSGVELAVSVAGVGADKLDHEVEMSGEGSGSQCRLPASRSGSAITTGIPSSVAELTLTLPRAVARGSAGALSADCSVPISPDEAPLDASLSATMDLRKLEYGAVHRLSLPGYASPLGALDLVVSRCVRNGVSVVHLGTTVELTNAFYTLENSGSCASLVLRASFSSDAPAFAVAPRSTQFIPLPVLQDRFGLEMDGCVYTTRVKFLTWAMILDAMTVMDDHVVARLQKLGLESEKAGDDGSDGLQGSALCGGCQVRVVDSSTISFPVVLRPQPPAVSSSVETGTSQSEEGSPTWKSTSSPPLCRVVQLTWRRHCCRLQRPFFFTGKLSPCKFTVKAEPVWTLWNCTGCRLRLRLCLPRSESVRNKSDASAHGASTAVQPDTHEGKSSAGEAAATVPQKNAAGGDIIGDAVVENGACFQWVPTSLLHLAENVQVFFQIQSPCPSSVSQWWPAAAPLSLKESPPAYIRLQQSATHTQGAVSLERHGSSTIVVRCAALLRSSVSQPVYLRDASRSIPLLGTDPQGCLRPQQLLPLFYSEYVTTLVPNAKRVGFTVLDKPLQTKSAEGHEDKDTYYVTHPVAATVLIAGGRDDCTVFYSVSAAENAGSEIPALTAEPELSSDALLWRPAAVDILVLRPLCSIHNVDTHRALFVRPYAREGDTAVSTMRVLASEETCIPPGETREVLRFSANTEEPEVQFCYSEDASPTHAHLWSPSVRLLSLATSTLPLVLKHVCVPSVLSMKPHADTFDLFPVPRSRVEVVFGATERCRCLALQSTTADGRLCVSVSLHAAPPLRVVNRLNTNVEFMQTLTRGNGLTAFSTSSGVKVSADSASTALCSRTKPPCSYIVASESNSFGCWEVPTLEFQGVRITLHSNRRKGVAASVDVDLVKCAAAPSTGLRVEQTDAYVYVSLDHVTHQYTITVVPTRHLESCMLFQPRRLTQLELFVPRCTVYVSAVTVPATGPFHRATVIACGARGRLRTPPSVVYPTDEVVPRTASDEDVLAFLQKLEMDVLCVRVVGIYSSVTATEHQVLGSVSVGIVEVLDSTVPEAEYPVVFRMSSSTAQGSGGRPSSEICTAAQSAASATMSSSSSENAPSATTAVTAAVVTGVARFNDPSWCNVEVQLTRSDIRTGSTVMLPLKLVRISVPPVTLHLHDELLFTVRTCVERVREELKSEVFAAGPLSSAPAPPGAPAKDSVGDFVSEGTRTAVSGSCRRVVYNLFLYQLHISAIKFQVTYTRSGDRRYNPFRNLGFVRAHLIPSMEAVDIKLKEVSLTNVELLSVTSVAKIAQSFVWPLYRTQLLLQSYKVVGSLDILGNPRALLGSWSRGVWDLVTNSSGKSRWADTREFMRTTTSSTLHSVGVMARSIGSLTGAHATAPAVTLAGDGDGGGAAARGGVLPLAASQRRGLISEVLAEVSGGVADVVTKPIRGAREGGVSGFFMGVASGVVGLVGRPVFGFFRGVSVTSEFYAGLLGGETMLTEDEARRLALERNYRLFADPTDAEDTMTATHGYSPAAAATAAHCSEALLTSTAFEQLMSDVPRWRRGYEKNVRAAVKRAGLQSAALFVPYASVSAFFTPEEFAKSLPTALTALLTAKLLFAVAHSAKRSSVADDGDAACGDASPARLARECDRASHIKASLGCSALHKYVAADVFVRVCSLAEIVDSVTATDLQTNYVILLAKAVNAAGDELFMPNV